jgi:AraC-like DNA-binding protein
MGEAASARDVARHVRQVIAGLLAGGGGSPDIQRVAETIGTSLPTRQRRLATTRHTNGTIVQQARFAAARELLTDPRRRNGDIARSLGYSDPAHFTRAFQRWTGVAPRDFRWRRGRTGRRS